MYDANEPWKNPRCRNCKCKLVWVQAQGKNCQVKACQARKPVTKEEIKSAMRIDAAEFLGLVKMIERM